MIGDFTLTPSLSSFSLRTALLGETTDEDLICSIPLDAFETLIYV